MLERPAARTRRLPGVCSAFAAACGGDAELGRALAAPLSPASSIAAKKCIHIKHRTTVLPENAESKKPESTEAHANQIISYDNRVRFYTFQSRQNQILLQGKTIADRRNIRRYTVHSSANRENAFKRVSP